MSPEANAEILSAEPATTGPRIRPKELSWLAFNERVLLEAADDQVAPLQRLRFLGIFSNNLDEFYRVRVARVSHLAALSAEPARRRYYRRLLAAIRQHSHQLEQRFEAVYRQVLGALRRESICLVNEDQLQAHQAAAVTDYFHRQVLPALDPVLLDENRPMPRLQDGQLYLGMTLQSGSRVHYAMVAVPTRRLPRFVPIPARRGRRERVFIVLENVIRHCGAALLRGVLPAGNLQFHAFKLTLDAQLELDEYVNQDPVDHVAAALDRRQENARPERFVFDRQMPRELLGLLTAKLALNNDDGVTPGGRYPNAKDFMDFPRLRPRRLDTQPLPPLIPPELAAGPRNIFQRLKRRDALLYYPYHSFDITLDLLKTAAIDPAVEDIQICLYRLAHQSRVVDALLSARRNHKAVTAVVELRARFDEAANIDWARRLEAGGVRVVFGDPDTKVHSKLLLIRRREEQHLRHYSYIGTGNFNEATAALYTDLSLMTADPALGREVARVFRHLEEGGPAPRFEQLWVSPAGMRAAFEAHLEREIRNARAGLPASIILKCNNLTDDNLIQRLYEASGAGVRVDIICRSMCSLLPGVPGLSDNIRALSIVDGLLEHPRVFVFHNGGAPRYYISSADLMTRNLDYRVEVTAPVTSPELQQRLHDILDIQLQDNRKARDWAAECADQPRPGEGGSPPVRAQQAIHRYLQSGRLPAALRRARQRGVRHRSKSGRNH